MYASMCREKRSIQTHGETLKAPQPPFYKFFSRIELCISDPAVALTCCMWGRSKFFSTFFPLSIHMVIQFVRGAKRLFEVEPLFRTYWFLLLYRLSVKITWQSQTLLTRYYFKFSILELRLSENIKQCFTYSLLSPKNL